MDPLTIIEAIALIFTALGFLGVVFKVFSNILTRLGEHDVMLKSQADTQLVTAEILRQVMASVERLEERTKKL